MHLIGDEETSHESSTTDSEFEIIGSSSAAPSTAVRAHHVAATPSSADGISSLATRKSGTFKDYVVSYSKSSLLDYDGTQSESNRTPPRLPRGSHLRCIVTTTTTKTTTDKSTSGAVRRRSRLPRRTPAKYDPIRRQALKLDEHNDASQHSSKLDHESKRPPSDQPPLQQEGNDDAAATLNEDPEFEALLEGPWKDCRLDEVD